jgi:Putative ABC exporter
VSGALLFLLRRTAWGRLRLVGRRMRTVKGALSFGAAFLVMGAIVAFQLWMMSQPFGSEPMVDAGEVAGLKATVAPMLVVLTLLTFVTGRALYFTPAEVDFLFPAPVSRRALLAYNVASRLGIQVLSGLWTALFLVPMAPRPGPAAAAVVLAFVFMYLTAQVLSVAASAAEQWLPERVRRAIPVVFIALALAAVGLAAAGAPAGTSPEDRVRAVASSDAVRAASVATRPYVELFFADGAGAALGWAALCLAILAVELGLLMAFDVAFTERSLAVSRRMHARLAKMRSGGGTFAPGATRLRFTAPRLAFLGRAAPLARRQLTELARNPKALVPAVLMTGVWLVALVVDPDGADPSLVVTIGVVLPVAFTAHLPFDFRRDVDRMPLLRSLPLSPTAVAVGQLFPSALLFTLMQMLLVFGAAGASGMQPIWLLGAALALPPFAWAALALDNLLFLLMPYRVSHEGEPNMQFMGKVMLAMLLKVIGLGLLVGLAALAAWAVYAAAGGALVPAIVVGSLVLAAGCVPLTLLVGRAFEAFEPRDVPA